MIEEQKPKKLTLDDKVKQLLTGFVDPHPTPTEIATHIMGILCQGNQCLKNPSIVLDKNGLVAFIEKLDQKDREKLVRYLNFFKFNMEPLFIFTDESRPKSKAYFENMVRSNFALHVIFSIIEDKTKLEHSKHFIPYLKENFEKIKKTDDLDELGKQHSSAFPKNGRRAETFYAKWLLQKEKEDIIKDYRGKDRSEKNKAYTKIEQVIGDVYGSMRSAFSHSLGYEHLKEDNYTLVWKEKEGESPLIAVYPEVSIDRFLCMSWLAILRSFGWQQDS